MATRTLNQVKKEIQGFARAHGQLFTGKFSNAADLLDDEDVRYPALYFDYTGARKDRNELVLTLQVWIADRVNPERDNEAEVWSDTTEIACDLLAFLDDPDKDYRLQEGTQMRPFSDDAPDDVAGVAMDIVLRLPFPFDRCIIPLKPTGYLVTEDGVTITTEEGKTILAEQ